MLPQTIQELDQVRKECFSMVTRRASVSGLTSANPIPGADIASDVAILLEMLPAINRRFGLSPEQIDQLDPEIKKYVLLAAKTIGNQVVGKIVTKKLVAALLKRLSIRMAAKTVVKYIPFAGPVISASIGFGAMKIAGNAHVKDCYEIARRAIEARGEPVAGAAHASTPAGTGAVKA